MSNEVDLEPRQLTARCKMQLQELMVLMREDIERVDEPQLKAMLETTAEVLGGLKKRSTTTNRRTRPRGVRSD